MNKNLQTLIEEQEKKFDEAFHVYKKVTGKEYATYQGFSNIHEASAHVDIKSFLRKSMEMAYESGRLSFLEEWLPEDMFEAYKKLQSPEPEKEDK